MPTVFNAANEKAVELFLEKKIGYLAMAEILEDAMEHHDLVRHPSLEDILAVERDTREYIGKRHREFSN